MFQYVYWKFSLSLILLLITKFDSDCTSSLSLLIRSVHNNPAERRSELGRKNIEVLAMQYLALGRGRWSKSI